MTVSTKIKEMFNILLVDDDEDDRELFKDAVREAGVDVALFVRENAEGLMEELYNMREKFPDIIFLDLNMPKKNGYECLTEIKKSEKFKNIPVVIYSTSYNLYEVDKCFKAGANLYVPKPDSFSDLVYIIKETVLLDFSEMKTTKENFVLKVKELR